MQGLYEILYNLFLLIVALLLLHSTMSLNPQQSKSSPVFFIVSWFLHVHVPPLFFVVVLFSILFSPVCRSTTPLVQSIPFYTTYNLWLYWLSGLTCWAVLHTNQLYYPHDPPDENKHLKNTNLSQFCQSRVLLRMVGKYNCSQGKMFGLHYKSFLCMDFWSKPVVMVTLCAGSSHIVRKLFSIYPLARVVKFSG